QTEPFRAVHQTQSRAQADHERRFHFYHPLNVPLFIKLGKPLVDLSLIGILVSRYSPPELLVELVPASLTGVAVDPFGCALDHKTSFSEQRLPCVMSFAVDWIRVCAPGYFQTRLLPIRY